MKSSLVGSGLWGCPARTWHQRQAGNCPPGQQPRREFAPAISKAGAGDASFPEHPNATEVRIRSRLVLNHFNQERAHYSRQDLKPDRIAALAEWRDLCAAQAAASLPWLRRVRISLPAVIARCDVSWDAIWHWRRRGDLPKPVRPGPKTQQWRPGDLETYEAQRLRSFISGLPLFETTQIDSHRPGGS